MLRILGILNPFVNARGRALARRKSRAHQPCVSPLEARALLASFQGLGANTAAAVSADGSVVVGNLNNGGGSFYWTQNRGVVLLRDSSGNIYPGLATGVSGNGSVIVGDNLGIGGGAFRWANGIAAPISQVGGNGSGSGSANSVSSDGTIIVGDVPVTGGSSPYMLTGATLKIILPPGDYSNPGIPGSIPFIGTTISANGAVVAGNPGGGTGGLSATWQWKNGTLVQFPDSAGSYATAVSPDGSVVVGSIGGNGAGGNTQAFEWTNGVVTPLTWPAGYVTGSATAASTEGATIVGLMSPPANGGGGGNTSNRAFIWNQATGVQNLQQALTSDGLGPSLTGWTLTAATAITPDGNTIVGNGLDPQGSTEGWIVHLNPPPTLQSIDVTPASPTIPIGAAQQFTATGTFSDNSTENLTSQVTWASAAPSVAAISSTGLARALATGTSSITASLSGVSGATMLTVTRAPILRSITVTPANPSIAVGAAQQFIATGSFSDNSTEILTSQVTWASATPSVATISTTGLARALATGTSSITASLSGVTGEAILTVTHTPPPLLLQTKTLLTATPRSLTVGQSITLSVSVSILGVTGSIATGTVTFSDGNTSLGTYLLRHGKFTFKTKALPVGHDPIQVSYSGNTALLRSSSKPVIVTVRQRKPKRKRG